MRTWGKGLMMTDDTAKAVAASIAAADSHSLMTSM